MHVLSWLVLGATEYARDCWLVLGSAHDAGRVDQSLGIGPFIVIPGQHSNHVSAG